MAAVPSTGRAGRVEPLVPHEASATHALYERYANQIFGYCLHQLGSREEAEDAVQSTFLNAFRGLRRGIVPKQESAWLFKIAHNVCLSRRRSTWRRGRVESSADFEVVEDVTPAPLRRADELIGLQDVLEQMPQNQRRAILLREWQGLSYREIAEELDLSQAAVETLIFRARRTLAQGLEQPPEPRTGWGRRARAATNVGGLLTGLKSLLLGATAAKVAGTAAVLVVGSLAATGPLEHHTRHATTGARVAPAAPRPASETAARDAAAVTLQAPGVERAVTTAPLVAPAAPRAAKAPVRPQRLQDRTSPAAPPAPPADAVAPAPASTSAPVAIARAPASAPPVQKRRHAKGARHDTREHGQRSPAPPALAHPHGVSAGAASGNGNGKSKSHAPAPVVAQPAPAPAPAPLEAVPPTDPSTGTDPAANGGGNGNGGDHGDGNDGGGKDNGK